MGNQQAKRYHGEFKNNGPWQNKITAKLAEEYGQTFGLIVSSSLTEWVQSGEDMKRLWLLDWKGECFITAYSTTKEYGGPEEGGWWYDWSEPILTLPCLRRNALQMAEYLAKRYAPEYAVPKGSKYSDVNCGQALEIYPEAEPCENRSTQRPHYE